MHRPWAEWLVPEHLLKLSPPISRNSLLCEQTGFVVTAYRVSLWCPCMSPCVAVCHHVSSYVTVVTTCHHVITV